MRILYSLILLLLSQTTSALELIDVKIPAALKKAYDLRYQDPTSCIDAVDNYMVQQKSFIDNLEKRLNKDQDKTKLVYVFPAHLQAFCYAQLEDYPTALNLLQPLLRNPSASADEVTTLNLIALNIPEEERPQLSNTFLLTMLNNAAQNPLIKSANIVANLQLTIADLSLQINHYHDAYIALAKAQKLIETHKEENKKLTVWLDYYYGLYYDLINQPQLAISYFLSANQQVDNYALIKLSGQIKQAIANIYQNKHRFQIALNFTRQQVELYQATKNQIKQATSLIELAILERKNNDFNQSIIYLFNALDTIQNNNKPVLLARIYLELGRAYLSNNSKNPENLILAQKYLQNARLHFTRLNKPRYQVESLLLLAKLNMRNNDSALAILLLEKALNLSQNKFLPLRMQAFEMLAANYEKIGNLQQAIVHFKNFYTLQTRIKEHLFELQQLQVSEQLQLLEKAQQQKDLAVKNAELQTVTDRYQILTYSSISLLTLIILLFFYTLKRNIRLNHEHQDALLRLSLHPRTKLPFQYANSNHFQYIYHDSPLYYALLNIPFLSQLNELLGTDGAMQIEKKLGEELQSSFSSGIDIFQFRGNQILFIAKQKEYKTAGHFAQEIEDFFTVFCKKQHLKQAVSCGIVAFPFLNNASRALSPSQTLNLSSLALFAASQIRKKRHQSSWVELYAIDNLQPAFLNGDLWKLAQLAIEKGVVKINTSHTNFQFKWSQCRE